MKGTHNCSISLAVFWCASCRVHVSQEAHEVIRDQSQSGLADDEQHQADLVVHNRLAGIQIVAGDVLVQICSYAEPRDIVR